MKQILTPLKGLFTSLIIGTALVACSKEAPAPTDEKIDKGHEDTFTESNSTETLKVSLLQFRSLNLK